MTSTAPMTVARPLPPGPDVSGHDGGYDEQHGPVLEAEKQRGPTAIAPLAASPASVVADTPSPTVLATLRLPALPLPRRLMSCPVRSRTR